MAASPSTTRADANSRTVDRAVFDPPRGVGPKKPCPRVQQARWGVAAAGGAQGGACGAKEFLGTLTKLVVCGGFKYGGWSGGCLKRSLSGKEIWKSKQVREKPFIYYFIAST